MRPFLGSMMFDVKLWVFHPVSYIADCDRIFVEKTFVGDLPKISAKKTTSAPARPGSTKAGWKSIFDGLLNWWFGFLGSPYIKDCYLGVPLKSQTTGPQTNLQFS